MIDVSVFNAGNLTASIVAGLMAGLYLAVFHPPTLTTSSLRRSLLSGWYFGFLGSILYVGRLAFSLARDASDPDFFGDAPRILAAWVLWLLFAVFVAVGAYTGAVWRLHRLRSRLDR